MERKTRGRNTSFRNLSLAGGPTQETKYILIDTDEGTDDAWALFMALASHQQTNAVQIIGITAVCGNTEAANVSKNITRTLQTVGDSSIPIFQGMDGFIMNEFRHLEEPPYHGYDGFGDADLPPIEARLEPENGVNAIIRLAEQYKDQLTIVALGPLTNLAMAVKLKPEIKNWIKEVYVLGGNMDALGNMSSSAEFNFFVDPEAAAIAIDSYLPLQFTILPWEVAVKASSTKAFRIDELGTMNTPQIELLNAIEAKLLERNRETWLPPDAVVMACVLDPRVILATGNYYARAEVTGTHTRGMLAVDKAEILGMDPNIRLITDVNAGLYEDYLKWAAGGPPPQGLGLSPGESCAKKARVGK